ncbi:MAG: hypothetical protein ACLT3W_00470 [Bifidobacterium pseudocatenulatum]
MSSRKLVSVQEITNIEPIEGADRIEVARILGWRVVVGKDMHLKPGDRVAYFETDSLLPAYDPRYKASKKVDRRPCIVGHGVTGHVLRTVKLRGVYSRRVSSCVWTSCSGSGTRRQSARTSPIRRMCSNDEEPPPMRRCSDRPSLTHPCSGVGRATSADAHRLLG